VEVKLNELPKCPKCKEGVLVPIEFCSTPDGHSLCTFVGCWVCFKCHEWVGQEHNTMEIHAGKALELGKQPTSPEE
jgi:hypothetical protein